MQWIFYGRSQGRSAHQGSRERERESKINELLGFSRCGCERMFILSNEEILTQECNRSVSCQKLQILTAVKKKIYLTHVTRGHITGDARPIDLEGAHLSLDA